jgi:hypothetical protein
MTAVSIASADRFSLWGLQACSSLCWAMDADGGGFVMGAAKPLYISQLTTGCRAGSLIRITGNARNANWCAIEEQSNDKDPSGHPTIL